MRTGTLGGVVAVLLGSAFALPACSDPPAPPAPQCVTLNPECSPLFDPPTYSKIFSDIFHPTCAIPGTCHAPPAPKGPGLSFVDQAESYQLLLGTMGGRARVSPDNPGCSILAERLLSKDPAFRMPPGSGLSDQQLCDVVKWLVAGAPNN